MACYHFTLKLDRKPDNTAVSAETHLDYINRAGKFKDIDLKRALQEQEFTGNMLCPVVKHNQEGITTLYRSAYGSIINNGVGIETTKKASLETLQISLALARKQYGDTLSVEGTTKFKARVLVAAAEMDYPIHFHDADMEAQYKKMQEEKENGRREFSTSCSRGAGATEVHLTRLEPVGRQRPPQRREHLQILSQCSVDEKRHATGVLLPRDHASLVEQQGADRHPPMRRDVSGAIRVKAEQTAEKILSQNAGGVLAASHADYINRQENFAAKGGCIYTAHHLPKWANGSAKEFFRAADLYERSNGVRYREIEFALPNELSLAQQKEIIDTFIDRHLKDHYYAYAIHDKIGAMSNGEHNTHVHIMFSDRQLDMLEREHERTPEMFFHRANAKHPEKGGCAKAPKWNDRNRTQHLCQIREDFARIQNEALEKYGAKERVDHRSLKDQYLAALKENNIPLARSLNRLPEVHIGPTAAANKNSQKVIDILAYRQYKIERSGLINAANVIEAALEDKKTQEACKANLSASRKLAADEDYAENAGYAGSTKVTDLKEQVIAKMKEIAALRDIVIWQPQAVQLARESFMTLEERELCHELRALESERNELTKLEVSMPAPSALASGTDKNAYEYILDSIDTDIYNLDQKIARLMPQVGPIEERLVAPAMAADIQKQANAILQDDFPQKQKLKQANSQLSALLPQLEEAVRAEITKDAQQLATGSKRKLRFTAREIAVYLKQSYLMLSRQYKQQQRIADQLNKKVISFERANAMARKVYLKVVYKPTGKNVQTNSPITELTPEQKEAICANPAAAAKIADIAKGIIRKNMPATKEYETAKAQANATYAKLTEIKELQKAVHRQVIIDEGKHITYPAHSAYKAVVGCEIGDESFMQIARHIHANDSDRHGHFSDGLYFDDKNKDYAAMSKTEIEAEKEDFLELL